MARRWDRQGQTDQQRNCSAGTTSTTSQRPPSMALPVVGMLWPPPSPHGGRFIGASGDLLGSGPDVYADMGLVIQLPVATHGAGGCPWDSWMSTARTTVYIPTQHFSTASIDWPSSVRCAAMRFGPPPWISIGFLPLISLLVGSKPKSQLFKFNVGVTNTWQHKQK